MSNTEGLFNRLLTFAVCATLLQCSAADAGPAPIVDGARLFPAPGQAGALVGGRVLGSNGGQTVGFEELARVRAAPPEGTWVELRFENTIPYRYVKYEAPDGAHGMVAEVEFYDGARRLSGESFGVAGTRGEGRTYQKALDGETATWFDAFLEDGAYVGLDLGTEQNVTARPQLSPEPGHHPSPPLVVTVESPSPQAAVRFTTDGSVPTPGGAPRSERQVRLEEGIVPVTAVALEPGKFPSPVVSGVYSVGDVPRPEGLVTFSTGNSLSDTFNGWLEPVARSAGYDHRAYRFSVPGAPTDWLWNHPGKGFGRPDYHRAFAELAPIDILITQPFHGHGRSIENEARHSGNFYTLARESSPHLQLYLYQQWPGRDFGDGWAQLSRPYMEPVAERHGLEPGSM
ncbi:MAG: hypothetical protein R6V05_12550 [Candidatus Brocadiia bacterium]